MQKKGFEIVKPVLEKFKGLPERLANLFGKSAVWYRSHGYALRKDDPLSNGSLSAVDHLLKMADEYEAAAPGAGRLLGELLSAELRARYGEQFCGCDERAIRLALNKEYFEALQQFDKNDLSDQSAIELAAVESEFAQIETVIADVIARVRKERRLRQASDSTKERFGSR